MLLTQLKNPKDMPCGLEIGYDICNMQKKIFTLAMDMDFDDDDFIQKYMNSDFCNKEMDAPYSFFHMTYTNYAMAEILDEICPEKNNLHYDTMVIEWIGWIYRYLQLRFEISSKEIYKTLPLETMLEYYPEMHTEDPEYFIETVRMEKWNI